MDYSLFYLFWTSFLLYCQQVVSIGEIIAAINAGATYKYCIFFYFDVTFALSASRDRPYKSFTVQNIF